MNIVRPRQNGHHFTDNTFQLTFYMKKVVFWFKFHWNLFKKVWLIKSQHWFGRWHQTGDKSLIEKIMVYFSDTYRGLVQDCSNSSASAMELLQSCAKPSIYASQGCDELNDIIYNVEPGVKLTPLYLSSLKLSTVYKLLDKKDIAVSLHCIMTCTTKYHCLTLWGLIKFQRQNFQIHFLG